MEKIKNQSFPSKTKEDWKEKAETSLKGKKIESLETTTYENIILKPLYTRKDEQKVPDYPAGSDFRRGIDPLGYHTNDWRVSQRITYQTLIELQEKLLQSFATGQSAISYEVSALLFEEDDSLLALLAKSYHQYPFAINTRHLQTAFLKTISRLDEPQQIKGYIGADPVALFTEAGCISDEFFAEWVKNIQQSNRNFPNLRTILIDTVPYHNGGANAVQELGIAMAVGVYYLEKLQETGMEPGEIAAKMIFQFSIGSNFFLEIAKLRAARVLWNRITELYGVSDEGRGMMIAAETSTFTKTIHDSHVNLLRAGNETFAAVMGGIQYFHVSPFNELTGETPSSERIARNIQLLLKGEAHLKKVIDPAGGSWYVEELTNQLAEQAWEFFQKVDAKGGILEALRTNWLQAEIEAIYEKRSLDIQSRRQSIVGTNFYANLDETVTKKLLSKGKVQFVGGEKIEALPGRRLAEPFEELRYKAGEIEGKFGSKPSMGMICLGDLKQYKTRLDFMKGFLAAGGIGTIESMPILSMESAIQFVSELTTEYYCLCGTNDQYEGIGHEILPVLKAKYPNKTVFLAGLPDMEQQAQWKEEGIAQFIHVNSNCYETLATILNVLEVSTNEETKA